MFWGLSIEGGKHYSQIVNETFNVTMAALETREFSGVDSKPTGLAQVMVRHDRTEFLLCSLQHGHLHQQPLNLCFSEGEEVTFFMEGKGMVHLSGYLRPSFSMDDGDLDYPSMSESDSEESLGNTSDDVHTPPMFYSRMRGRNLYHKPKRKRPGWRVTESGKDIGRQENATKDRHPRSQNRSIMHGNVERQWRKRRRHKKRRMDDGRKGGGQSSEKERVSETPEERNLSQRMAKERSNEMQSDPSRVISTQKNTEISSTLPSESFTRTNNMPANVHHHVDPSRMAAMNISNFSTAIETHIRQVYPPVSNIRGSIHGPSPLLLQSQKAHAHPMQSVPNESSLRHSSSQSRIPSNHSLPPSVHTQAHPLTTSTGESSSPVIVSSKSLQVMTVDAPSESMETVTPQIVSTQSLAPRTGLTPTDGSPSPHQGQDDSASQERNWRDFQARLADEARKSLSARAESEGAVEVVEIPADAESDQSVKQESLPMDINQPGPSRDVPMPIIPDAVGVGGVLKYNNEGLPCYFDLTSGPDVDTVRLAEGYNVFISKRRLGDIEQASRECSRNPWSLCIRRLLDAFFDRETLAMGKATDHGHSKNPNRQPLNQEIIQAIKVYVSTKHGVPDRRRNLTQCVSDYIGHVRTSLQNKQRRTQIFNQAMNVYSNNSVFT
ncbi:uncharacterized protein LOC117119776 isoform X4 [Anneissia japonica]|uniref:uncharacterized protein LOC117119776 isoform X4 n=1 Tax=Anneissia japonica TaxID=1529436 RepID=UPI0014257F88|nr:uncharacterized protein LOC117119776 isoform X4 [Anneissia japonica]XP_033120559.1 uncharacterized protein LOC117119776 isoform X4 [Anneissia japonica]